MYLKNQNFQKYFLIKVGVLVKDSLWKFCVERFDQFFTQKKVLESINFKVFEEVVHDFGRSNDDMI